MFHIGQKVMYVGIPPKEKRECIHTGEGNRPIVKNLLLESGLPNLEMFSVHTVRDVDKRTYDQFKVIALRLENIIGKIAFRNMHWEWAYCSCGFKSLSEDYLKEFDELRKPLKNPTKEDLLDYLKPRTKIK